MLRNIVLVLGGTLLAAGLVALIGGAFAPALIAMVWGAIIVFGILYERYAYKNIVAQAPTGKYWVKTTERFVDDKTGKTVTVHTNTVTGERAYVAE
ncbi:MAG: hypothetical protein KGI68_14620 [Alphaproteobacteria bacterium]|nr:hypothetical protein [Alphaproteobacteria bacterium]MDE1987458.1 hypothetical protein [Alphaproteobacteria bacterium]MDE2164673.1 hypothetical protein [Alphaproteobacteria bacterium]